MTEQHPLTDEKCKVIMEWLPIYAFEREDSDIIGVMRTAYDKGAAKGRADMLEQVVIAWENAFKSDLKHRLRSKELAAMFPRIFAFGQVLAAMRPQQQKDNNND